MELGRIVGTVVSTRKSERLEGFKLLLAEYLTPEAELTGTYVIGVDIVDAGVGDVVLIVRGSSSRQATDMAEKPVDTAFVAVVDTVQKNGEIVYSKKKDTW